MRTTTETTPPATAAISIADARARLRRAEADLDAALAARRDARGARAIAAADRGVAVAEAEYCAADDAVVRLAADEDAAEQAAPAPAPSLTANRIPEATHLEVDDREATGDDLEPVAVKLTPKRKTFLGMALRYVQEAAWNGVAPGTNDGVVVTATMRDGTKTDATEAFLAAGWGRWTELRDYREALRAADDEEAVVQLAADDEDEDIGDQSDLTPEEKAQALAEGLEAEDELESLTEYGSAATEVTRVRMPGFMAHAGNLARRHLRRWAQAAVTNGIVDLAHPALATEAEGLLTVLAADAGRPAVALVTVRDEMLAEMVRRLRGLWMSWDDDGDDEPPTPPAGGGILVRRASPPPWATGRYGVPPRDGRPAIIEAGPRVVPDEDAHLPAWARGPDARPAIRLGHGIHAVDLGALLDLPGDQLPPRAAAHDRRPAPPITYGIEIVLGPQRTAWLRRPGTGCYVGVRSQGGAADVLGEDERPVAGLAGVTRTAAWRAALGRMRDAPASPGQP